MVVVVVVGGVVCVVILGEGGKTNLWEGGGLSRVCVGGGGEVNCGWVGLEWNQSKEAAVSCV